jgi:hypothetical protein
MGLIRKFSSKEATLPENFLPRGKQSFPENLREAKLPENFLQKK